MRFCSLLVLTLPVASATALVSDCLEAALDDPPSRIPVVLRLAPHLDIHALSAEVQPARPAARRARVVREARRFASRTQAPLRTLLHGWESLGRVENVRSLWISNELAFAATPEVVESLRARPDVAWIGLDQVRAESEVADGHESSANPPCAPALAEQWLWNLEMIRAPSAWARGFEGQGVIISNIDSGMFPDHPDYASRMWQNVGEVAGNQIDDDGNGHVDDTWGWDFDDDDNTPGDQGSSHGTNSAGVMVGDGTSGTRTGVAPRGTIQAIRSCRSEFSGRAAYQYAVESGADVISSSCSYKISGCPDYAAFRRAGEVTALAGVFHTNSIGNQGGIPGYEVPFNIGAPAHGPASFLHPDQIPAGGLGGVQGCGAVDHNGTVKPSSGEGPSQYEFGTPVCGPQYVYDDYPWDPEPGCIKPDYSAPTDVMTTKPGGGYTESYGGTSAATPHSGGAATVILSAVPDASPAEISEALQMTAEDRGAPGKDNRYGAGIIDVDAAVAYLLRDLTVALDPPALRVPKRGEAVVQAEFFNNTDVAVKFTVECNVYFDDGRPLPSNPKIGPIAFQLAPRGKISRTVRAVMPGFPGTYTVEAVLKRGQEIVSSDDLRLVVAP